MLVHGENQNLTVNWIVYNTLFRGLNLTSEEHNKDDCCNIDDNKEPSKEVVRVSFLGGGKRRGKILSVKMSRLFRKTCLRGENIYPTKDVLQHIIWIPKYLGKNKERGVCWLT